MTHATADGVGVDVRPGSSGYSVAPILRTPLVGGRLVEFRIADPETAAARAEIAPGGVTFLQADHLRASAAKRAAGGQHSASATVIARFDGTLDAAAMTATLTAVARRHEEWRSVYTVADDALTRAVAPASSIAFTSIDTGRRVVGADLVDHIVHRVATEAIFDALPGMTFGAAQAEDHFTFYLGADHGHTDGFSIRAAITEIAETYRSVVAGTYETPSPAPLFTDYIVDEKARAAAVTPDDPRVVEWGEVLARTGGRIPTSPLDLGLAGDETPPAVRGERALLDAVELADLDASIAALPVSLTGVIHAALAAAERELFGTTEYFTATVLSTRTPETFFTQGWLCNFAPVAFDIAPAASPLELASHATDAVRRARRLNAIPVHAVLGILAAQGKYLPAPGSPQMVSYIDFRAIPGNDDPVAGPSDVFSGLGRTRNANMWVNRFTEGLLVATLVPDNDVARASSAHFLAVFERQLRDLAAHARSACTAGSGASA